jgi:hypothetical protein
LLYLNPLWRKHSACKPLRSCSKPTIPDDVKAAAETHAMHGEELKRHSGRSTPQARL